MDVLGEVRRAQRILRRVEKYLHQQERASRRKLVGQPGRKYEEFMQLPADERTTEPALGDW